MTTESEQQQQQQPPVLKTYRGNCHCGAFVYEARLPGIDSAHECNCSICYKKGYLWLFVGDEPGDFTVVRGEESQLSVYTFGGHNIQHKVRWVVSRSEFYDFTPFPTSLFMYTLYILSC